MLMLIRNNQPLFFISYKILKKVVLSVEFQTIITELLKAFVTTTPNVKKFNINANTTDWQVLQKFEIKGARINIAPFIINQVPPLRNFFDKINSELNYSDLVLDMPGKLPTSKLPMIIPLPYFSIPLLCFAAYLICRCENDNYLLWLTNKVNELLEILGRRSLTKEEWQLLLRLLGLLLLLFLVFTIFLHNPKYGIIISKKTKNILVFLQNIFRDKKNTWDMATKIEEKIIGPKSIFELLEFYFNELFLEKNTDFFPKGLRNNIRNLLANLVIIYGVRFVFPRRQ